MKKIVECVPNFSEGRDAEKIAAIIEAARKIKGVKILNVDSNPDYNRTVLTFVGEPRAVKKAAFEAIKKSMEVIDMRNHKGGHPRIGACDVCPFVPVKNITMEECIKFAANLAKDVAKRLKIPVYLYGEAAIKPERKDLSSIRQGEYEGLKKKLKDKKWKPDFGPSRFIPQSGACVIGARDFLIAYNVNVKTVNKKIVDRIAMIVRGSGFVLKSKNKEIVRVQGILKDVKALGVFLRKAGICQVSMNLTNFKETPLHIVFETIKNIAPGGIEISGSEIVGLVPKEAILAAGKFYSPKQNSEKKLIASAIRNLGLNSFKKFNAKKRIIEYLL